MPVQFPRNHGSSPLQQTKLSGRAGHNCTNPVVCKTHFWQLFMVVKPKQSPWKSLSGQVVPAMLSSFSEEGKQEHFGGHAEN